MRTANPALNSQTFGRTARAARGQEAMTVQGTANKTALLLICTLAGALWTWNMFMSTSNPAAAQPWMIGGAIGGFVVALITIFKQTWAPYTGPMYAVLEGLFLGGISAMLEVKYPGIAFQAVVLTFGTLACLLVAYKSRMIEVTQNFRLGVFAATGAIALIYLVSFVAGFFGASFGFIHGSGWMGIGFSLVVVVVAALNLVLDFDFIEQGAAAGAPKYMEWYAAFALMVTLVWLYIEILRLLAKLRGRE
jgi:uncharacterized YccA/Bax inhibitor family protein